MYKITLEKMGTNEALEVFTYETRKEAKQGLKQLAKKYEMSKTAIGTYVHYKNFLELGTNF